MKYLLIILFSVFAVISAVAQNTDLTIVYTNNTNGNLENCF